MREVEIKAKVNNFDELINKLEKLGLFLNKEIIQEDRIYLPKNKSFFEIDDKTNVLRLRKQEDKIIFTLSRRVTNELDCIERELEVSNLEEMEKILIDLGYVKILEIKKARKRGTYKNLEICIDKVENLGDFMEVEKLTEDYESKDTQEDLKNFLFSIGIKKDDLVYEGYDTLMIKNINK